MEAHHPHNKDGPYVIGQIKQVNYSDQYLLERNHKLKGKYNTRLKQLGKKFRVNSLKRRIPVLCLHSYYCL
jgi:hypothetical protein